MNEKITSLKGNDLTSRLLKNYRVPIPCKPVKSRLSGQPVHLVTEITFFRCRSQKTDNPYDPLRVRLPRELMGPPWDRLRANYRLETLINRGLTSRKSQSGGFESLLHRHIQYTKPLISKENRGFVVSGVWNLLDSGFDFEISRPTGTAVRLR